MGNSVTSLKCGNGAVRKVRVLLPDGNIKLLDGPVEVAELMTEHLNHMVVHCSTADARAIGKRPSMTIMQPNQQLQPGESYLVYPIPPQYKSVLFKAHSLSLSKHKMATLRSVPATEKGEDDNETGKDEIEKGKDDNDDENQQPKSRKRRSLRVVTALLPKSHCKATGGDSSPGPDSEETQTALLDSDGGDNVDAPGEREELQFGEPDEGEDEGVHFNIYMGWRPALESIPEYDQHDIATSPLGYDHPEYEFKITSPLFRETPSQFDVD